MHGKLSCQVLIINFPAFIPYIIYLKFQFSSPVANAWILRDGVLKPVSVFDNKHVPAMSSFQPPQDPPVPQPLLYIGRCSTPEDPVIPQFLLCIGLCCIPQDPEP